MQDLLNTLNLDALGLSVATGLATLLVILLKALFALARRLAKKTPVLLDDKIVDQAEAAFREKSRDI